MNREIKFRIWDNVDKKYLSLQDYQDLGAIEIENDGTLTLSPRFRFLTSMMIMPERFIPQQYVGLKDKNGVEIYENMILDNKYIVLFENCKYILKDISNGNIIDLWRYMNENRGEITKEYSKI
jgi:hypothetical protein